MDTKAPIPVTPSVPEDQPEKYIRTFAGDMETLKAGGTPNLIPLSKPSVPKENPVAAPVPPKGNVPAATPAPAVPETPAPVSIPIPASPPPIESSIETYAGDFRDRMKETQASTVTVLAAEQDSAPVLVQSSSQPESSPRANILYSIAGGILLIAGGTGAYIAYSRYQTALAPVVLAPSISAPIFVDDREQISGNGATLLSVVEKSVARSLTPNTVRLLYIASTTGSIFAALPLSTPGIVLRNVNAEGSMAGVINVEGIQSPFFILSVSSYSNTFSGMLSWEKLMPRDLAKLFPPYSVAIVNMNITATTTATTTPKTASTTPAVPVQSAAFFDTTIANHDVRVYRDAAGRSVFLYGYWNQTTLVIARDAAAFTEILQRLATSRVKS